MLNVSVSSSDCWVWGVPAKWEEGIFIQGVKYSLLSKQQSTAASNFFLKDFLNVHSPLSLLLKHKTMVARQDVNFNVTSSKHISATPGTPSTEQTFWWSVTLHNANDLISALRCISSLWNWSLVFFSFGEGNGTPLQYSCLENPMDGGAW